MGWNVVTKTAYRLGEWREKNKDKVKDKVKELDRERPSKETSEQRSWYLWKRMYFYYIN